MGLSVTNEQVWYGLSGLSVEKYIYMLVILFILYFHNLIIGYGIKIKGMVRDIFLSTVFSFNMIFYTTINILKMPFKRIVWTPTNKNPNLSLSLTETIKNMWFGSLVGLYLLRLSIYYPYWFIISSPMIFALIFSIPVVYFTSKKIK